MKTIEKLRKEKNLSQEQIAKIAEMSQSNYSKYERGILDISLSVAIKLANYFNVSLDFLCDRKWENKAYIEVWKLSDEQKANLYLIQQLTPKNNLRANGYLMGLFQEQGGNFMYFLLSLISTGILGYFMPQWMYNLTWKDLTDAFNGGQSSAFEEFIKDIGLTNQTASDIAREKIVTVVLITLAIFVVMLIITSIIKKALKKSK